MVNSWHFKISTLCWWFYWGRTFDRVGGIMEHIVFDKCLDNTHKLLILGLLLKNEIEKNQFYLTLAKSR